MDKQSQFKTREQYIFQAAEDLLLEQGESGMTLDTLAMYLDIAKGTLYKHFQSKDELYMHLIIRHEQALLDMIADEEPFADRLEKYVTHQLDNTHRTLILHQIEERLADTSHQLRELFSQLYHMRRIRLRRAIGITNAHLIQHNSSLSVRDYLASVWSLTHGAAALLNSTFHQRYLGDRSTFKAHLLAHMLDMPSHVYTHENNYIPS